MFEFELNQPIVVLVSGEQGFIKGRAEYTSSENSYLVHGVSADGKAFTVWFNEEDLREKAE
ncbi:Uncharacterised protein [Serratia liquefaciens]|uniref:hypothetical protein n=1 Tax=Serratia TaxID=613 RepID=UPI00217C60F8|nr:hypothetical protein [Serratia liquefaciens]CAI1121811.1 Uncharacterised protein [Serratia liquefaciens]HBL6730466.1 hypothetical protein [Serratia liquefaciens]